LTGSVLIFINQEVGVMTSGRISLAKGVMGLLLLSTCLSSIRPMSASPADRSAAGDAPDLGDLDLSNSEMRVVIERYVADRGSLSRSYPVEMSPARLTRFKQFYSDWLALIGKMNFDTMGQDGKIDYVLFKYHLNHELQQLDVQARALAEIAPLLPFAQTITDLAEARRRMEKIEPRKLPRCSTI
jgi:hypothetical protein